ncbi:MAG: SDR family oxidoreductase [Gammaproteobacteria bacterium]
MQLSSARIVLTGATGGLGEALAAALSAAGATLLLTGRNAAQLEKLAPLAGAGGRVLQADLSTAEGVAAVAQAAGEFGANGLVNNAGVGGFGLLAEQDEESVERILATNLTAPIQLTRAMLPGLLARPEAAIVNVGSAFGSIPFAGFAAYSAAKTGLRGFSQALRRELADSPVRVIHVAPRAIDTPLNSPAVVALNKALGNACDSPAAVAARIVGMLKDDTPDALIGFPERLFAWLNGCAPSLIDRGVRGKLAVIKQHAAD